MVESNLLLERQHTSQAMTIVNGKVQSWLNSIDQEIKECDKIKDLAKNRANLVKKYHDALKQLGAQKSKAAVRQYLKDKGSLKTEIGKTRGSIRLLRVKLAWYRGLRKIEKGRIESEAQELTKEAGEVLANGGRIIVGFGKELTTDKGAPSERIVTTPEARDFAINSALEKVKQHCATAANEIRVREVASAKTVADIENALRDLEGHLNLKDKELDNLPRVVEQIMLEENAEVTSIIASLENQLKQLGFMVQNMVMEMTVLNDVNFKDDVTNQAVGVLLTKVRPVNAALMPLLTTDTP